MYVCMSMLLVNFGLLLMVRVAGMQAARDSCS